MRRDPDNAEVIDDSGSYDVREFRGERGERIIERIIERQSKSRDSLYVTIIAGLVIAGVGAAWGFTNGTTSEIAGLKVEVANLKEQVTRLVNRMDGRSGILRGGPDEPHAQ